MRIPYGFTLTSKEGTPRKGTRYVSPAVIQI